MRPRLRVCRRLRVTRLRVSIAGLPTIAGDCGCARDCGSPDCGCRLRVCRRLRVRPRLRVTRLRVSIAGLPTIAGAPAIAGHPIAGVDCGSADDCGCARDCGSPDCGCKKIDSRPAPTARHESSYFFMVKRTAPGENCQQRLRVTRLRVSIAGAPAIAGLPAIAGAPAIAGHPIAGAKNSIFFRAPWGPASRCARRGSARLASLASPA